jgi:two-component system, NarL family, sensor kinase
MQKLLRLFIIFILAGSLHADGQRKVIDSLLEVANKAPGTSQPGIYYLLAREYVGMSGDTAVEYAHMAIELAKEHKDHKTESDGYSLLGKVEKNRGNFSEALTWHLKSLKIKEAIKDNQGLAGVNNDVGIVYKKMKRYEEALVYYQKANELAKAQHIRRLEALTYNNIGTVYIALGKDLEARGAYDASLKIAKELNDPNALATVLTNIGDILRANKQYKEALDVYKECLQYDKALGDKYGITMTYLHIGRLSLETKDYKQSKLYLDSAASLARNEGLRRELMDILAVRSNLEDGMGNKDSTLFYLRAFLMLKDSIFNEDTERQLSELKTQYETEKNEKEIAVQRAELSKKNYIIGGISSILLLGMLLGFSSYRRYRLKQQARLQTEIMKQQELATQAVLEAEEKERKRIAGDLHDGIGQLMSAASMNLSAVSKDLSFENEDGRQAFDKAASLVDESCRELRAVSHNIMPNALLKAGLASAIRAFIDKIDHRVLEVNLYTEGFNERLPANIETVLYRVVQESVNNVIKHSGADKLDITLIKDEDGISITIEDNGKGFETSGISKFEGIGLKNMQTRVEYLKGSVEWDSALGKGTVVTIQIPN